MAITYVAGSSNVANTYAVTGTIPTGSTTGDLMIALCSAGGNFGTADWADDGGGSNGWTRIVTNFTATGRDEISGIFYKIHDGSESDPTFTLTDTDNDAVVVIMATFRGVDTSTPFDVTYNNTNHFLFSENDGNPASPDITTNTNGAFVLLLLGMSQRIAVFGAPTGYTLGENNPDDYDQCAGIAYKELATAGAENPGVWQNTDPYLNAESHAYTLAIKPALAGSSSESPSVSPSISPSLSPSSSQSPSLSPSSSISPSISPSSSVSPSLSPSSSVSPSNSPSYSPSSSVSPSISPSASTSPSSSVSPSVSPSSSISPSQSPSLSPSSSISPSISPSSSVSPSVSPSSSVSPSLSPSGSTSPSSSISPSVSPSSSVSPSISPSISPSSSVSPSTPPLGSSSQSPSVSPSESPSISPSVSPSSSISPSESPSLSPSSSISPSLSPSASLSPSSSISPSVSPSSSQSPSSSLSPSLSPSSSISPSESPSISPSTSESPSLSPSISPSLSPSSSISPSVSPSGSLSPSSSESPSVSPSSALEYELNRNLFLLDIIDGFAMQYRTLGASIWNNSGRPSSPKTGDFGFNTTLGCMEIWNGSIWLNSKNKIVAIKSGNYTLETSDEVVVFTATATATLPASTGLGHTYRIVCRAGITTIDANGSETIKGELTQVLYPGEDLIITDTGVWE